MADADRGEEPDGADGLGALFGGGDGADDADRETEVVEPDDGDEPVEHVHTLEVEMEGLVGVYHHDRHRNGDVTAVYLCALADGYQALAIDVAQDGEILETEAIGYASTAARAASQAEYWLDQHPDGILGSVDEDGGGLFGDLFGGG